MNFRLEAQAAAGLAALLLAATSANATNLITNGDFETGDFTGWTEVDQAGGFGSWFVQAEGDGTPINGLPTPTLATGGSFFASTDQTGQGSHSLSQSFTGTAGGTYVLSFDAYANDLSGVGPEGTGTDYTTYPNQHVEVDLNGSVIYYGILTPDWAAYSINVSSDVVTGTNTLTFVEVDNQLVLNEGLDNVSLTAGAPEPAAWALLLTGFAGLGGAARVARRRMLVSTT
ncbi:MAG TPA: hypothetical protein VGL73_03840 [Caulobacteraceae bacterium]|jgi:hypothetical protein